MNKNVRSVLITCLILVGLAALAIGIYFAIQPTDKEVFSNALKENFNSIKELGTANKNIFGLDTTKNDLNLKLSTNTSITQGDATATITGDIYKVLENYYAKLSLTADGYNPIEAELFKKDNRLYHKLNGVYSKFYYTDLETEVKENNNSNEKDLFDYLTDAIIDNVNDDNLTKEDKDLTLGGESYDTEKYTVTFTQKKALEVLRDTVNNTKDSEELYNTLTAMLQLLFNSSETSLVTPDNFDFNNFDDLIENADDKEKFLTYSVYLYGGKSLSNEVALFIKSEESDLTLRLTINSYENKNGYNNFEVYLSMMGFKVMGFELRGTSDTKSDISIYFMDTFNVDGTFESTDSALNINLIATTIIEDEEGNQTKQEVFTFNIDGKEVVKDKEYDINMEMIVPLGLEQVQLLKSTNKLTLDEKMPEVDVSDSAPIEEMTEEERYVLDSILPTFNSDDSEFDYSEEFEEA